MKRGIAILLAALLLTGCAANASPVPSATVPTAAPTQPSTVPATEPTTEPTTEPEGYDRAPGGPLAWEDAALLEGIPNPGEDIAWERIEEEEQENRLQLFTMDWTAPRLLEYIPQLEAAGFTLDTQLLNLNEWEEKLGVTMRNDDTLYFTARNQAGYTSESSSLGRA